MPSRASNTNTPVTFCANQDEIETGRGRWAAAPSVGLAGSVSPCHRPRPVPAVPQVNLVSEHIWCEDFLVRSFYLKNLQTNETRTVTQFHFLSWYDQGVPSSTRSLLDFRR